MLREHRTRKHSSVFQRMKAREREREIELSCVGKIVGN